MPNERLRAALLQHGLTPQTLAGAVGVDPKTVERWVGGRTPYRRHRYAIAAELSLDESYLWPEALSPEQVAAASESEVVGVYPHRSEVPREVWTKFFTSAEQELGILVYAGQFLAEDATLMRTIAKRVRAGVRLRLLVGDPDSANVAQRAVEEGADGAMALKIRSVLVWYRQKLGDLEAAQLRMHDTVLYNSIYRADDELLINTQIYGTPASVAPVWHLRKVPGGEIWSMYAQCFERVWDESAPLPEE